MRRLSCVAASGALLLAACTGLPALPPREAPARPLERQPAVPASPLTGDLLPDVVAAIDSSRIGLDLDACLRLAGARAPELERARARLDVVRAQAELASLVLWPSLQPQAFVQGEQGRIVSSTGDVPSTRRYWSATLGVALGYVLNPMAAIHDRNASMLAAEAGTEATEAERQAAMRRAGALYADLQEAHALATLAHEATAAAAARVDLLREQARVGLLPAAAAADAELDAARRARELHEAAAAARRHSVDLAMALRLEPRVTIFPAAQFRAFALVDPSASLDGLLARAAANRPERRAAEHAAAGRAAAESAARWSAFAPTLAIGLFAGGAGRLSGSPTLTGPEGLGARTSVGVGVYETLSGEALGRIGVAAAGTAESALESALLAESIAAEVVAARTTALDAFQLCQLAQREVAAAVAARVAAERRREGGLDTGVDVLLRREHVFDAQRRAVAALAAWNRAQIDLLFAVGSLGPAPEQGSTDAL